jgi:hypothetical protein
MRTRMAWLLCATVVFGAYGVLALMTSAPSEPPEMRITPPAPNLAPKLAALSGMWESAQDSLPPTRVVVERIDETRASLLLLIGPNHPSGYPCAGWERVRARVLRDGGIEWGYPERFTLRLAEDAATLEGQLARSGVTARTTLKKVGAFVRLSGPPLEATMTEGPYPLGEQSSH